MKKIILFLLLSIILASCSSNIAISDIPLINNQSTVVTEDYLYAVGSGAVNSATVWNKWGYNDDVDVSSSPEVIASWGGDNSIFLDTAETLSVVSTDSNDVNGGSGANSVVIYGIDENREEQIEVIFLNGLTPVTTSNTWLGVNRVSTYLVGGDGLNDGVITLTSSDTSKIQGQIPLGAGSSQQAFLFTQANHTFLSNWLWINVNKLSGGGTPKVTIRGYVKSYVSQGTYEIFQMTIDTSTTNIVDLSPITPFVIGEKSILYFTATTDTNNAIVNLRFSGIEKENAIN